jgi:ATP-dependent DNA helicase RecQ
MYVAMTRAEETLCLLKSQGKPNPFLKEINGNFVMPFTHGGMVEKSDDVHKRYEIAGLKEIYLDYAGGFPQTHPIHSRLAALKTGQRVNLVMKTEKLEIRDHNGECVGRLSKEGAGRWREHLNNILEVRVVGILQRNRDDPDAPFHKRIKVDKWEFPVLEIISTAQPV